MAAKTVSTTLKMELVAWRRSPCHVMHACRRPSGIELLWPYLGQVVTEKRHRYLPHQLRFEVAENHSHVGSHFVTANKLSRSSCGTQLIPVPLVSVPAEKTQTEPRRRDAGIPNRHGTFAHQTTSARCIQQVPSDPSDAKSHQQGKEARARSPITPTSDG